MSEKLFKRLEIAGAFVVFLLATLLHFLYYLYPSVLTSLFAAVNESIWEHIKIFTIAYLFYAFIELLWAKPLLKRFVVSKTMGALVQGGFIPIAYYSYTFFVKKPALVVDLLIGFLASVLGFLVSYGIYKSEKNFEKYFLTSVMFLFLILMMLLCFTYYPPEVELFRDVITGGFGVTPKNIDMGAFAIDALKNIDIF
ncbi:MAG: hypothetical protein IJF52_05420 [Clostridia bacterium]|nr:hypothetical protein [Clostridia bacterium]